MVGKSLLQYVLMQLETAVLWSWLNVLTHKRYHALVDQFGTLDAATEYLGEPLLKALGCREETIIKTLNRLDDFDLAHYKRALEDRSISLISQEDEQFPANLKQLPDCPVFLYYKGSLDIVSSPCIALVGSRKISQYGRRVTEEFVPALVRSGLTTVSGLANGIDSVVAEETIAARGHTVAVLGHGMGQMTTHARTLADKLVAAGGLLLSEYPLDFPGDTFTFPARNRIIAGLSLGVVVLQAGEGSGALITADLSLEYNRDAWAVPGDIFDEQHTGCHVLLQKGQAGLASSPDAIISALGLVAPAEVKNTYEPIDEQEAAIYTVLTSKPQSISDIVDKAAIDAAIAGAKLTMLELNGAAKNVGNGMWVRT